MTTAGPRTANLKGGSGGISLALGLMAVFGFPARLVVRMAGPAPSGALLLLVAGFQILLAIAAVYLGIRGSPSTSRRPASAWAGIALGGFALALSAVLLVLLTINNVSKAISPAVAETEAVILQPE